jgi:hypothetical protein
VAGYVSWGGRLSAQSAQERVSRLEGRQLDPGIRDDGPVRPGDDRIEVEAGDLGQVVGEPGDPQQQVAQAPRSAAGRPSAPDSSGAERTERISLSASVSVSGVSRAEESANPRLGSTRARTPAGRRYSRRLPGRSLRRRRFVPLGITFEGYPVAAQQVGGV